MNKQDFHSEHLKQLPLRALVAFSVRCARRVQALTELPEGHPGREKLREDVEAALRMAEGYASGSTAPCLDSVVEALDTSRHAAGLSLRTEAAAAAASEAAHAAACAWHLTESPESEVGEPRELKTAEARESLGGLARVTADLAARNAFAAALAAYQAVGLNNEDFTTATLHDYDELLRLKLGRHPEAGASIDPSPRGPLGPF